MNNRLHLPRATVLGAVALTLLASVVVWWLSHRAGPDFYARPESLLPPETAAVATWRDFTTFLDSTRDLRALELLRQDEELTAFLLTDSSWRKLQRKKDEVRYKALTRLADRFVRRWLGNEVTVALIPPSASASEAEDANAPDSGLLVIARTDAGFEENLADLVAQYHPELALETRKYRGQRIHRYNAEKSRYAFTYCRFGQTVVVSLRSAEWGWIQEVVDRKIGTTPDGDDRQTESLADDPVFQTSFDRRVAEPGELAAFVEPRRLTQALRHFPSESKGKDTSAFWFDYCDERLAGVAWGVVKLRLHDGLRIASFWKPVADIAPERETVVAARAPTILATLPADSPLVVVAESPRLREMLLDLCRRMSESKAYDWRLKRFETGWAEISGTEMVGDCIKPMGDALGVALTGMAGMFALPMPRLRAWWEFATPDGAEHVANLMAQRSPGDSALLLLPIGQLASQTEDDLLLLGLNETEGPGIAAEVMPPTEEQNAAPPSPGLVGHPLLRPLWNDKEPPPVLCLFANFRTGYAHAERLHSAAALWSKDVRRDVEKWQAVLAALRHLDALRLTATPTDEGVEVDLLISVN